MAQKFLTDIEVTRGLVDSSGDLGVAGQVLSSTGTGTNWITNEASSTVVYQDGFTGDNSTVDFTLSISVTDENVTQVYIDGVYQTKDTYSIAQDTLTFSTAPPLSADIEVITFATVATSDELQAGVMIIPVKNTHTASIAKGEPVYITGNVGSSARLQIAPADASNSTKMPAAGLLLQTLAVNAEGYVVTGGYLRNLTTDTIDGTSTSSNDTVYVKSGGGLTMTKPTGTNLIQNIAKVARVASGSAGSLIVSSILRTNDVPNITNDYFWLGNSSGVATPTEFTSSVRGLISTSGNAISYNSSTGVITANYEESPTFTGDVIISGNLTVNGTETILNTQTVEVEDNIIQLNTTQGSPDTATATTSGISVYRGNGVTQASFIFDDTDDTWDLTNNLVVAGSVNATRFILPSTGTTTPANQYLFTNNTNTATGKLIIQSGEGSASYGGAINLFSHSHSTKPGWVTAGISSGSGGKFSVNTQGLADGTDVFTVDTSGNATFAGSVGIGEQNPQNPLHLYKNASQGNPSSHTPANATLRISDSANTMYLDGNSIIQTGAASFTFGNTQASDILFYTNATERMRIDSSGDLTMQGGRIYVKESDLGNNAVAITRDADEGYVQLFSSGTQTIEIRGNGNSYFNGGNVGISNTSPSSYHANAKNLVVGNSGNSGISIVGGTTGRSSLHFADGTSGGDESRGYVIYRHTENDMLIGTDDATAITIDNDQRVGIGSNSPTAKLDVKSNGGVANGLNIIADFNRNAGADAQLILGYYANGSAVTGPVVYAANSLPLLFATSGSERIRIAANGSIYNSANTTNVHFGLNALSSVTSADESTAFGSNALGSQQTNRNSAFGFHTLQDLTTGAYNTAVGGEAAENITTGSFNVAVGSFSLRASTTGTENVAIGYSALNQLTTGGYNTAVGSSAGVAVTDGVYNTLIGRDAAASLTSGNRHVAIGYQASLYATTQSNTVAIGYRAGFAHTASGDVYVGYHAGYASGAGNGNVGVGFQALYSNTSGYDNTVVGYVAGENNGGGYQNAFFGFAAGRNNTSGSRNTFVGNNAGTSNTTGIFNTLVGNSAGDNITTGNYNSGIGGSALNAVTTGNHNQGMGYAALNQLTVGVHNIGIGYDAFQAITNSSYNTGVGGSVGTFQTGNYNTSMGYFSNYGVSGSSSGSYNSTYGYFAGAYNRGENNTFLGALAGRFNSTGVRNTIVGSQAADNATITGNDNTALGFGAAHNISSAIENVSIGSYSFFAANGSQNVAVGKETLYYTTSTNNTAVGHQAGLNNTSGGSNTFIGRGAGYNNTTHDYGTFVGELAGYNNQNHYNAFFGRASAYNNTTGTRNTYIGYGSGYACTTGYDNTGVGTDVLANLTTGANNTALGRFALNNVASGNGNIAVGYSALGGATMSGTGNNIALGGNAGYNMTSGSNNILIGLNAGRTGSQTPQSMGGVTTGSNQIHIGNESHTNALVQVSWTVNSDGRDKTDVKDLDLGLDFINSLRPVTYRWDKRSQYEDRKPTGEHKESKLEIGLIAQEVIEQENKAGYNFEDETNLFSWQSEDKNKVGLQYEKLVPALINSIKELKEEIEILKSQINI